MIISYTRNMSCSKKSLLVVVVQKILLRGINVKSKCKAKVKYTNFYINTERKLLHLD